MVPDRRRDGPQPTNRRSTRRSFLRTTGAASVAWVAGCSALPPLGGGVRFGRVDAPGPGQPVYRPWLPDPDTLSLSDEDGFDIVHARPARWLRERPVPIDLIGLSLALAPVDWLGYALEDVERVVGVGEVRVVSGDFDPAVVADALAAGGYERLDAYRNATIYGRPENRLAAVREDAVLWAVGSAADQDVRRVLDARAGEIQRYHEVDDDFALFSDHVGASVDTLYAFPFADPTDEVMETAMSVRFDEDATFYVNDALYPAGTEPPIEAIKDALGSRVRPGDADAVDVEATGRVASIEMRFRPEQLHDADDGDHEPMPWVTWEHDLDGDQLTIRHVAGESVAADRLDFDAVGSDGETTRWAEEYETVGPGDELTVLIEDQSVDRVVLAYETGEHSTVALYDADLSEGSG